MDHLADLPGLQAFERIAALGSLTAAASDLGLSLAVVSKRLASFERRLGVQLIHRSTRRLSVTEEGTLLYTHAIRIIGELELARVALRRSRSEVSGTLKITAPNSFGRRRLVPLLASFSAMHPNLRIQLQLSDEVLDLVAAGLDLAIRYGELPDSRLAARVLIKNRRILCASPAYLQRCGQPLRLADLTRHDCILIGNSPTAEWRFNSQAQRRPVRIVGRIICNDGEAAHALALQGAGIVLKSAGDVAEDIENGRLVQVLPRHAVSAAPLSAVYLQGQHLAPRVRTFIDFLAENLSGS